MRSIRPPTCLDPIRCTDSVRSHHRTMENTNTGLELRELTDGLFALTFMKTPPLSANFRTPVSRMQLSPHWKENLLVQVCSPAHIRRIALAFHSAAEELVAVVRLRAPRGPAPG